MNTFTRNLLASVGTASVLALGVQSAQAATFGCVSQISCSLQELVDGGLFIFIDGLGRLVVINDFQVTTNIAPVDLSSFLVSAAATPSPGGSFAGISLDFSPSNFVAGPTSGLASSSIFYNYNLVSNGYTFNSASYAFTSVMGTQEAAGIKTLQDGNSSPIGDLTISFGGSEPSSDSITFAPQTTLRVFDAVTLNSPPPGSGDIQLLAYTQTFDTQATPEPGTILGLVTVGVLGAFVSRKRKE